jgi:hypothetical protein
LLSKYQTSLKYTKILRSKTFKNIPNLRFSVCYVISRLATQLRTFQRDVEAAEAIAGERVRAALQDDGRRLVRLHDLGQDRHEDVLVAVVVDAVAQGEIDGVVLPLAGTNVL